MTDSTQAADAIARAAAELIPQLAERLRRHGLGEIEVSHGDLRLRVAGGSSPAHAVAASEAGVTSVPGRSASGVSSAPQALQQERSGVGVASPAVGFFVYMDGLGPGLGVEKGDALGHVEVLGVRHDVRAPRRGTVRHLVAESGEAVEYGQVVVELEAVEALR